MGGGSSSSGAGAVQVLAQFVVEALEAERFYELYLAAFGHLREAAAARQVLTREEFFAEMADERVTKYVARGRDDELLGLATVITDLDVVPWVSPEYYAARYPEHAARRAIRYVGFMLSHPQRRALAAYPLMVNAILTRSSEERAVLLWDMCRYNEDLGFGASLTALVGRQTGVAVELLDVQTYYGAVFS